MNQELMDILEKFFNNTLGVLHYGYTEGVYIVSVMDKMDFGRDFDRFNNNNGVAFVAQALVNNKFAVSCY